MAEPLSPSDLSRRDELASEFHELSTIDVTLKPAADAEPDLPWTTSLDDADAENNGPSSNTPLRRRGQEPADDCDKPGLTLVVPEKSARPASMLSMPRSPAVEVMQTLRWSPLRSGQEMWDKVRDTDWKTLITTWSAYIGPGYMVCIGYMDPGNWATDLAAGSTFGYTNLFVIFMSNLVAIFLQYQAVNLAVCTGLDLAEHCRVNLPKVPSLILYVLAEASMIATDIAEVIGSAIAMNLLFGIPLIYGVLLTGLDVFLLLFVFTNRKANEEHKTSAVLQTLIMVLLGIIAISFIVELATVAPVGKDVMLGYLPQPQLFTNSDSLLLSIGIIGATVMPHNLYLHSYLVKSNGKLPEDASAAAAASEPAAAAADLPAYSAPGASAQNNKLTIRTDVPTIVIGSSLTPRSANAGVSPRAAPRSPSAVAPLSPVKPQSPAHASFRDLPAPVTSGVIDSTGAIVRSAEYVQMAKAKKMGFVDTIMSLSLALFINSSILIVAAAAFYYRASVPVASIQDAYNLLASDLGKVPAVMFAIGLFAAGQSSTITGTIAGKAVMDGFIQLSIPPWMRRVISRLIAIVPAVIVIAVKGADNADLLLIWSQVILSLQLPFAVIPMIYFCSSKKIMGEHVNPMWMTVLGYIIGFFVMGLNMYYLSIGFQ